MTNQSNLKELEEPFYLNIVFPYASASRWIPCWYDQWAGSNVRGSAVKMRKEFCKYLKENGSDEWKFSHFKTVKITLYK